MKALRYGMVLSLLLFQSGNADARSLLERLDHKIWGSDKSLDAAYDAYDKGQFVEASKSFQTAANSDQSSQVLNYNAGVAAYKAGKPDEAAAHFVRAASGSDRSLKAKALFNSGVIHIDKNELEAARDILKEALAYDNDNQAIQENLAWVEEQLKGQPPEPKDENQKDQDQKNQAENEKQEQDKSKDQGQDQTPQDQKNAEEQKSPNQDTAKNKDQADQEKNAQTQAGDPKKKDEADKAQNQSAGGKEQDKDKDNDKEEQAKAAQAERQKNAEQPESKDKDDKRNAEQAQAMEAGQDQDKSKDSKGQSQTILTPMELKQQEAERLLRSIDDKIGRYPLTDTEATGTRGKDGKNW